MTKPFINHFAIPTGFCPSCRGELTRAAGAHNTVPEPGDIMVCAYCAEVLIFDDQLGPMIPTDEERAAIAASPVAEDLERIRSAIVERGLSSLKTWLRRLSSVGTCLRERRLILPDDRQHDDLPAP